MTIRIVNFCKYSLCLAMTLVTLGAYGAQAPNPRGGTAVTRGGTAGGVATTTSTRTNTAATSTRANTNSSGRTTVSRSATARPSTVVSRSAVSQAGASNVVTGRSGTTVRQVVSPTTVSRSATNARAASTNVVRGATPTTARAGATNSVVGLARAGTARATAVFTDMSVIGGGYAQCREAYATCMDQFCATTNDQYRRCVCSARYDEFRNTEAAIDEALNLLAQFEDNNLAAVGLSAEEVAAMYRASEGEQAIKRDTSAAAEMLNEISDLLSGNSKSSSTTSTNSSSTSLGLLSVDFTSDLDDIWGDTGSSIFDSSTGVDLSTLTGESLYTQASKQCLELVAESCESDAVLNMARSAYGIMITQDCNIYERSVNAKEESLKTTVRTAEKYLREARLEEYQSHNSADVNECVANVRTAMLADVACGPNYERCLDPTGAYINQTTGEPIYSPRLFQLADIITLDGVSSDGEWNNNILNNNASFNTFLDNKKIYAESALDTCRDISDTVWTEFKRQAIIEIAQAQDDKIEQVKMSCVGVIADCYDTQTGALRDLDTTTSQYAGAISAAAARSMCADQVIMCASLYGNADDCEFDNKGRLVHGNSTNTIITGEAAGDYCGLTALLAFVDTVDRARINEGCETAINSYVTKLCTPSSGEEDYPWNCRNISMNDLRTNIENFAKTTCRFGENDDYLTTDIADLINSLIEEVQSDLQSTLAQKCESFGVTVAADGTTTGIGGYWIFGGNVYSYGTTTTTSRRTVSSTISSQPIQIQSGITATMSQQMASNRVDGNLTLASGTTSTSGITSYGGGDTTYGATYSTILQNAKPLAGFYSAYFGLNPSSFTSPGMSNAISWGLCAENTAAVMCLDYQTKYNDNTIAQISPRDGSCILSDQWYIEQCEQVLNGYWENNTCYAVRQ